MFILPFDTETNGMIDWKVPSESEHQPHMVQLAAILVNDETREIEQELDVIIKPDGWIIPDDVVEIHGITTEQAMDEGIPEPEALDMFLALYERCGLRVAHNATFDNRIIRIALKRYRPDLIPDDVWKDKSRYYCTMLEYCKVHGGKWPKLTEAYKHLTGQDLEDAHSAMADAKGCLAVYWAIQDGAGPAARAAAIADAGGEVFERAKKAGAAAANKQVKMPEDNDGEVPFL